MQRRRRALAAVLRWLLVYQMNHGALPIRNSHGEDDHGKNRNSESIRRTLW